MDPDPAVTMSYQRPSLMSLPLELRREIYSYLLPSNEIHPVDTFLTDRGRGPAFMSTCRQIYEEAADLLYGVGNSYFAVIVEEPRMRRNPVVNFLNSRVTLKSKPSNLVPSFRALQRIAKLRLVVNIVSDEACYLCNVQDLIYKFLSPLFDGPSRLVDLEMDVVTSKYHRRTIYSTNAVPELRKMWAKMNFGGGLAYDKPDWSFLPAFLTDPLALLHVPSCNLLAFSLYFDYLRDLLEYTRPHILRYTAPMQSKLLRFYDSFAGLHVARLQGSISAFHRHHGRFIEMVHAIAQYGNNDPDFKRRLHVYAKRLSAALPPADVDTRSSAFDEVARTFRENHARDRAGASAAGTKRTHDQAEEHAMNGEDPDGKNQQGAPKKPRVRH